MMKNEMSNERRSLYEITEPFVEDYLKVSELHTIYYEISGSKTGLPVVILHGGPGRGSNRVYRGFFNPENYFIVQLDQRGSGKSTPKGSIEENTTWDLVEDIEKLRKHLNIDKWFIVVGGSWGSCLALVYSETHPTSLSNLIVAAVLLGTNDDIQFFHQKGASFIFPEYYESMISLLDSKEKENVVESYHKKIITGEPHERIKYAKEWTKWEAATSFLNIRQDSLKQIEEDNDFCTDFAIIASYYLSNNVFLDESTSILSNVDKIRDIPTIIIHGRYDVICPFKNAYDLSKNLPKSTLYTINDAGHSGGEPGIIDRLVRATEELFRTTKK